MLCTTFEYSSNSAQDDDALWQSDQFYPFHKEQRSPADLVRRMMQELWVTTREEEDERRATSSFSSNCHKHPLDINITVKACCNLGFHVHQIPLLDTCSFVVPLNHTQSSAVDIHPPGIYAQQLENNATPQPLGIRTENRTMTTTATVNKGKRRKVSAIDATQPRPAKHRRPLVGPLVGPEYS